MSIHGLQCGPISKHSEYIPPSSRSFLVNHYNKNSSSDTPRVYPPNQPAPEDAQFLVRRAVYFKYIVQCGRRIAACKVQIAAGAGDSQLLHSSLVRVKTGTYRRYGQITAIFMHAQPGHTPELFAELKYFKTLADCPLERNPWVNL